jgi:hypothetical protein
MKSKIVIGSEDPVLLLILLLLVILLILILLLLSDSLFAGRPRQGLLHRVSAHEGRSANEILT